MSSGVVFALQLCTSTLFCGGLSYYLVRNAMESKGIVAILFGVSGFFIMFSLMNQCIHPDHLRVAMQHFPRSPVWLWYVIGLSGTPLVWAVLFGLQCYIEKIKKEMKLK